jgi:hypothetical protein
MIQRQNLRRPGITSTQQDFIGLDDLKEPNLDVSAGSPRVPSAASIDLAGSFVSCIIVLYLSFLFSDPTCLRYGKKARGNT